MPEHGEYIYPVITDGEIDLRIEMNNRGGAYVEPDDGVVFGSDSAGNYFINGKKAKIKYRKETW